MKGSTHSIYAVLGCAAMLAGTSACSHSTPDASSPSAGQSSSTGASQSSTSSGGSNQAQPGFDSDRDTQGAGQQGSSQQGGSSLGGSAQGGSPQGGSMQGGSMQPGSTGSEQQGAQQQGAGTGAGQQGAQGSQLGGQGTTGSGSESLGTINEREACDLLVSEAMLHTEQVDGGIAIVAKPRRGTDVSTVRSRMQSIHRGIERGGAGSSSAQCELFALGRNGVATLIETPDSIRLLVTTSDAARVPQLRRQAAEFMRSKGSPGQRGSSGSQGGGSQGGSPGSGSPGSGSQGGSTGSGSQGGSTGGSP